MPRQSHRTRSLATALCVSCLTACGDEPSFRGRTVDEWRSVIDTTDERTRQLAVFALADLRAPLSIAAHPVIRLLDDSALSVREEAQRSLLELLARPAAPGVLLPILDSVLRSSHSIRQKQLVLRVVGRQRPQARVLRETLFAILEDSSAELRAAALGALEFVFERSAQPSNAEDSAVHRTVVLGLMRIARADRDPDVRAAAVSAIGRVALADQESFAAVVRALSDLSPRVREEATTALVSLGPPAAVLPHLVKRLSDPAPATRAAAASALGALGIRGQDAANALRIAAHDTARVVQASARDALALMRIHDY